MALAIWAIIAGTANDNASDTTGPFAKSAVGFCKCRFIQITLSLALLVKFQDSNSANKNRIKENYKLIYESDSTKYNPSLGIDLRKTQL